MSDQENEPTPHASARSKGRLLFQFAAVLAMVGLVFVLSSDANLSQWFDGERLIATLERANGATGPLLLIGIMAVAVVVSPLPSVPIDAAAGVVFGPLLGTLYAATGATLGALAAFSVARLLGRELLEPWLGKHVQFCSKCSDLLLTRVVFLSRLVPFLSFDLISYGAGLTGMSPSRFVVTTFLGTLPLTFAYVSLGSMVRFDSPWTWALGGAAALLMVVLPRWVENRNFLGLRGLVADHLDDPEPSEPKAV